MEDPPRKLRSKDDNDFLGIEELEAKRSEVLKTVSKPSVDSSASTDSKITKKDKFLQGHAVPFGVVTFDEQTTISSSDPKQPDNELEKQYFPSYNSAKTQSGEAAPKNEIEKQYFEAKSSDWTRSIENEEETVEVQQKQPVQNKAEKSVKYSSWLDPPKHRKENVFAKDRLADFPREYPYEEEKKETAVHEENVPVFDYSANSVFKPVSAGGNRKETDKRTNVHPRSKKPQIDDKEEEIITLNRRQRREEMFQNRNRTEDYLEYKEETRDDGQKLWKERDLSTEIKRTRTKRYGKRVGPKFSARKDDYQEPKEPVAFHSAAKDVQRIKSDILKQKLKEIEANDRDGSLLALYQIWSKIPAIDDMPRGELAELLANRVLFEDDHILGLDKPFGLPVQPGPKIRVCLVDVLDHFKHLVAPQAQQLYPMQRLDKETSGVMLIAKSRASKEMMIELFSENKVHKTYYCITKDVPEAEEGVIRIPLIDRQLAGGRNKMVPATEEMLTMEDVKSAVTQYRVLSRAPHCALVECTINTGVKHQIRAHLGFGIGTPIMGDSKYSNYIGFKPQRLSGEVLGKLGIRSSKSRNLPMFLHAKQVVIPDYQIGRNLFVRANLPNFFRFVLNRLKLRAP